MLLTSADLKSRLQKKLEVKDTVANGYSWLVRRDCQ